MNRQMLQPFFSQGIKVLIVLVAIPLLIMLIALCIAIFQALRNLIVVLIEAGRLEVRIKSEEDA